MSDGVLLEVHNTLIRGGRKNVDTADEDFRARGLDLSILEGTQKGPL